MARKAAWLSAIVVCMMYICAGWNEVSAGGDSISIDDEYSYQYISQQSTVSSCSEDNSLQIMLALASALLLLVEWINACTCDKQCAQVSFKVFVYLGFTSWFLALCPQIYYVNAACADAAVC